ncbi:MAG: transporter, partial [Candidatus Eisenbacteria bacterium]|nr:transporter [Candidatus Eisenbacteria bacterium]
LGGTLGGHRPSWWSGEGGYKFRGGDYHDEIVFGLAAGVEVVSRVWLRLGIGGISALKSTVVDVQDPQQHDPSQNASYASIGGALLYRLNDALGVEIGYSSDVAGENTFQGRSLELALEMRP